MFRTNLIHLWTLYSSLNVCGLMLDRSYRKEVFITLMIEADGMETAVSHFTFHLLNIKHSPPVGLKDGSEKFVARFFVEEAIISNKNVSCFETSQPPHTSKSLPEVVYLGIYWDSIACQFPSRFLCTPALLEYHFGVNIQTLESIMSKKYDRWAPLVSVKQRKIYINGWFSASQNQWDLNGEGP